MSSLWLVLGSQLNKISINHFKTNFIMENEQLVDRIVNNGTADSLEAVVREYFSTHPTAVDAIFEWTACGEDGDDINFTLKVERN